MTTTADAFMGIFGLSRAGAAIDLPIKTVAGLNAREHWRKRAARVKSERQAACISVKSLRERPELPVTVRLVRLSSGTLDGDNLQGAFKAIRDGVADAYGIPDNDPRIRWEYDQERCKRGCYAVRIELVTA
jgi:hypothetical protein